MPDLDMLSLFQQATIVVKIVISILVIMSLISWSIILTKIFALASAKGKIASDLESFAEAVDLRSAIQLMGRDQKSPTYKVALLGVTELNRLDTYKGSPESRFEVIQDNLRRALRQGVSDQLSDLGSSLSFLATCANAAPFIGLFGTVWGIMNSFHSIGDQRTAALAVVAPGISEALVATAIGLAVAIPATIAYNFFLGKLNVIEAKLVNFAGSFLNRVRRELPGLD